MEVHDNAIARDVRNAAQADRCPYVAKTPGQSAGEVEGSAKTIAPSLDLVGKI